MARKDEANESREGLLQSYDRGDSIPLRKSLDDAYRSSTDDELDVTEFLNEDASRNKGAHAPVTAYEPQRRLDFRRAFKRRSKCLLIILAVLLIFWSILA